MDKTTVAVPSKLIRLANAKWNPEAPARVASEARAVAAVAFVVAHVKAVALENSMTVVAEVPAVVASRAVAAPAVAMDAHPREVPEAVIAVSVSPRKKSFD